MHHSRTPAISDPLFRPLRAQVDRDYRVVIEVIDVIDVTDMTEMGSGTLVRTPVPCARAMMTLASKGKLPQLSK